MERTLCIPLGIIVERVSADGGWRTHEWRAASVLLGTAQLEAGSLLWREGDVSAHFAGIETLYLHASDVGSYKENLQQAVPSLYVVFAGAKGGEDDPPRLHLLTIAADEAESYADAEPELVAALPMPEPLLHLVQAYVAEHDVGEEAPVRRRPVSFQLLGSGGSQT